MLKIMKENKKKAISLIIGLLLIFGGILYIAVSNSDAKEDKNVKVSAKNIKEIRKDKKDAKKELEKAKKSGDKEEIEKAEKKLETIEKKEEASTIASSGKSNKTPSTASKPSSPSASGTSNPAPKPKSKQKVWIVDKPAWTETVTKTRSETRYRPTWCTYGNGTKKIHYSEKEAYNLYINDTSGEHASWGNGEDEAYTVQVPYTKTINHPEQGHWEYR